jgi:long-subunit fatty acid transport protein
MKSSMFIRGLLVIGSILVMGLPAKGQFAEDALRFSQLGTGVGARSLGLGNASIGMVDDYSALFVNPAGLALLRDYEFSVGISHLIHDNKVSYLGSATQLSSNATNLNNLGIVYPIATSRGSLTFAFGFGRVSNYTSGARFSGFNGSSSIVESMTPQTNLYSLSNNERRDLLDNNIPYQLFLSDIDTVTGRLVPLVNGSVDQRGVVREEGGLNNWSLGGAIDIAKDLSLGGTISIVSGAYTYDREFNEFDSRDVYRSTTQNPTGDFESYSLDQRVKSNISGYNVLMGLMYRRQGRFKFGITVRTPTYYEIKEDFSSRGRSSFDNGDTYSIETDGNTVYSLTTPFMFGGGGSIQIGDWLVLAGDAEYVDWTQMEFSEPSSALASENRYIKELFKPTTNLRGGGEITLWSLGIKLRGGIVVRPSPYVGDPASFNQKYYTGGVGFLLDEKVTLNLAYAFGTWKTFRDHYYISGFPSAAQTQERIKTSTANLTLSYRF